MILTVFRSRLRPEAQAEYGELAPQMSKLARSMPGYKAHKVFVAEDGERLMLVEFEDDTTPNSIGPIIQSIVLLKSVGDLLFTVNTRYKFAR